MANNIYIYEDIVALGQPTFTDDGTGDDWLILSGDYGGDLQNHGAFLILSNFKYSNNPGPTDFATAVSFPQSLTSIQIFGGIENAMGGAGSEVIFGSDVANMLQGDQDSVAGGADVLHGFNGDDTLYGMGGGDILNGGNNNDILYGDTDPFNQGVNIAQGNDTLDGGLDNDTLYGGYGTNSLGGGDGYDTASYTGFLDDFGNYTYRIVAYNSSGTVTVYAMELATGVESVVASDTLSSIEVIQGTAGGDRIEARSSFGPTDFTGDTFFGYGGRDTLYGSIGVDLLFGGEGDDFLWDGGNSQSTGGDLLNGGNGNDYYTVDSSRTVFSEGATGGYDYVLASFSFTLPTNIEHLYLSSFGGAINGTGNTLDNQLEGNASANTLNGLSGRDYILGFDGNDRLQGAAGNDSLYGDAGDDTLIGGTESDRLYGGAQSDLLQGGLGHDILSGGRNADIFAFVSAAETAMGRMRDEITDFRSGLDQIDLHRIAKHQDYINAAAFHATGTAEIRYNKALGQLSGDVDGNGTADWQIALGAGTALTSGDLIL